MPGILSDDALNQIQYVSMADFMRRVDEFDDFDDKLAFTTRYLLAHGMHEGRDHSFDEAVHIAKMKLADASAKARARRIMIPDDVVNPDVADPQLDAGNRLFMADPTTYLKREVDRLIGEMGQGPISEADQHRFMDYQIMSATLTNDLAGNREISNKIADHDYDSTAKDIDFRLERRFGGKRDFKKAYEATKPGVLAKMFGKYSRAYRNLDEAYQGFHNRNHVLYGDMNSLDKAATEYLQHVFPRWNPKEGMLGVSSANRLSGTQKDRAIFCINILKATAEQRKMESCYETIINANKQELMEAEAGVGDEENVFRGNQDNSIFQQEVEEDLAQEEAPAYDQEQAERDFHANFEEIADEVDDPGVEP